MAATDNWKHKDEGGAAVAEANRRDDEPIRAAINADRSERDDPAPLADLKTLNERLGEASAEDVVRWAGQTFDQRLVMTTSFGVQSAVMLHLVSRVLPDVPVIFIDTGFHFFDTYRFADQLTRRLGLNLQVYQSSISAAWTLARHGKLWHQGVEGMDKMDQLRKVEPMDRALREQGADAVLAGLRREQTGEREDLARVSVRDNRYRIHPILEWTTRDVHEYLKQHDLPYHPLHEQGYASVGDWYNTLPITADQGEREGRFGGLKQECGIHTPTSEQEDASWVSSGL